MSHASLPARCIAIATSVTALVASGCALDPEDHALEEATNLQELVTSRCELDYTTTNWNTGAVRAFTGLSTGASFNGCMNFTINHVANRCADYYLPHQWPSVEARSSPQLYAAAYYDAYGEYYYLTFAGLCSHPLNVFICKPSPTGVAWCIYPGIHTPDGRW